MNTDCLYHFQLLCQERSLNKKGTFFVMSLHIIILAAGHGKRMYSAIPKVLHHLGGQPMLARVIETAQRLNPDEIHVVIGNGGEQVKQTLSQFPVNWVYQFEQLGTGHAVMQALPHIPAASSVLILPADVPLIQADELQDLITLCKSRKPGQSPLGLMLASFSDPTGMGRILRDKKGQIYAIIEEKDANSEQRKLKEVYTGICTAEAVDLQRWLPQLSQTNAQKEYYLTDIIAIAVAEQRSVESIQVIDLTDVQGVNNRLQLQQLERAYQRRMAEQLMLSGVTLADASRIDIRGELQCAKDVFIDVNNVFSGKVVLGKGCIIGPNCSLNQVTLGDNCEILPNSVLEDCEVAENGHVGPFARLRPGTKLAANCKIGNFVETKKAILGENSKASHLSYLGDVTIGKNVNIGAGTITCNYDGVNKHQTVIEDGVFIGSDTQLIAPVIIGKEATIAAGSTIYKDVPAGQLTLTEAKQKTVHGWKKPEKIK